MSETAVLIISVIIFALIAKFTRQAAYTLCCFIRGAALILIGNCVMELMGLGSISLNLFTAPVAGMLGAPAIGFFWLISIFF